MKHYAYIFIIVSALVVGPAQARMMTPNDPVDRLQDGDNTPLLSAEVSQVWRVIKTKAISVWSAWTGDKNPVQEIAQAPERDAEGFTKAERQALTEKEARLPEVTALKEREVSQSYIESAQKIIGEAQPLQVSQPAVPGKTKLPSTKAGVPVFDLMQKTQKKLKSGKTKTVQIRVKSIPHLDIGTPERISKSDFLLKELQDILKTPGLAKPLKTPEHLSQADIDRWTKRPLEKVSKWNLNENEYGLGKIVTQNKVDNIDVAMQPEKVMEALKEVHKVTKKDLKMLMALILFDKGDKCHVATGLFHDLSSNSQYTNEADFYIGVCADRMGFHSEAVDRLVRVIQTENLDFTSLAIEALADALPKEYMGKVSKALKGLKNKSFISEASKDNVNYIHAMAAQENQNWKSMEGYASKVGEKSKLYGNAQYLYGIALYSLGQKKKAETVLNNLYAWMEKTRNIDNNLQALVAVNLGRIKFKQDQFQEAYTEYKKVPKNHPLWVDALIEQGWAQLNTGDAAGAIGNMYSLHSPYFRSVYMPESWVVRTIGYLNICQYGDAYRTLSKLEKMHTSHARDIEAYLKKTKSPSKYYTTVRNYIQGQSQKIVDGLPAQVLREVARNRGFLNSQNTMNDKVDEFAQYDFIHGILNTDLRKLKGRRAAALKRKQEAKAGIARAKVEKKLQKKVPEWQSVVRAESSHIRKLNFEIYVYESSRRSYKDMKKLAQARLKQDQSKLKTLAGQKIKSRLKELRQQIAQILEGNEFLRYEIFSGSGEDIRYQAAGGQTLATNRIPANVKPQKILNWEFDGEYWEDEIGNYRSTLRNNCPHRARSVIGQKIGE